MVSMRSPNWTAHRMSVARTTTTTMQTDTFLSVYHLGRWHRGHKLRSLGMRAPHSVQLVEPVSIPRRLLGPLPILRRAELFQGARAPSIPARARKKPDWNTDASIR